jgi:hypothetical protein
LYTTRFLKILLCHAIPDLPFGCIAVGGRFCDSLLQHVYAIEANNQLTALATQIIASNGLAGKIDVINKMSTHVVPNVVRSSQVPLP